MLVKARFSTAKAVAMVVTFSLMTPMGVGIGMGIASSYNADSVTSLTVQGVLSSFSGGLLLYISLVQMIAEDFTKTSDVPGGMLVRLGSYFMLALGAAGMVLIAVFGEGDSHGH
jgi:zinc transporter 1/2/3